MAPSVTEAVCTGGVLVPPTLSWRTTDRITYTVDADPPYVPNQTVVVTATLEEAGVGWPDELPSGWTETGPTTATFTVQFALVVCVSVLPHDADGDSGVVCRW